MNSRLRHYFALAALLVVVGFLLVTGFVWVTQTLPRQLPDVPSRVTVRDFAPPVGQVPWKRTLEEPCPVKMGLAQNPWRYRPSRPRPAEVGGAKLPWGRNIEAPVRISLPLAALPWKS